MGMNRADKAGLVIFAALVVAIVVIGVVNHPRQDVLAYDAAFAVAIGLAAAVVLMLLGRRDDET